LDCEITIDFETYGEVDLMKVGAFRYAEDLGTYPLCLAYSVTQNGNRAGEEEFLLWTPDHPIPSVFCGHTGALRGWNVTFEAAIWEFLMVPRYGFPPMRRTQWRDTMAIASYFGFPKSLEQAAAVVGTEPKDKRGRQLIGLLCKPCKPSKNFPYTRRTPANSPELFDELYEYCLQDVRAETSVYNAMPKKELPPQEQRIWYENLEAGFRGVKVDLEFVNKLKDLRDAKNDVLVKEFLEITDGVTPTQLVATRDFLVEKFGLDLPNLQAETIQSALASDTLEDTPRRVLEIRDSISKVAVKKLDAMVRCASPEDDCIRGMLVYYGAGTGRFAGQLVQLQNLARGSFKVKDEDIQFVYDVDSPQGVDLLYGDTHDFISTMIRPCLIPHDGKYFYDADYSAIEARGVAWLAGQEDMLKNFRKGRDVYKVEASRIYGVPYESIDEKTQEGWLQRWVGKTAVLGLGYQMGPDRFMGTCHDYGQKHITLAFSKQVVAAYREANYKIKELWYQAFDVFKFAIQHRNKIVSLGPVKVSSNGRYLFAKLPSGRTITYVMPQMYMADKSWGPTEQIRYKGIDSKTYKWTWIDLYGGKIVENLVQAIARDIMCERTLALIDHGFEFLFTVHDQIICQADTDDRLDEYLYIMSECPDWAEGFPVKAEGKVCQRFTK